MLSLEIQNYIAKQQERFRRKTTPDFIQPVFSPLTYYKDISASSYIDGLVVFRHALKMVTHDYFSNSVGAQSVDLFMMTPSVSSPNGPGSDSEPIPIRFGELDTFLVDSAQFGFEPLLLNGLDKLYCYAPSMRGEDPDPRHLNQFYHCELELVGSYDELVPIMNGYVQALASCVLAFDQLLPFIAVDWEKTKQMMQRVIENDPMEVAFDDVLKKLDQESDADALRDVTNHGRDIRPAGEKRALSLFAAEGPMWIRNYDRDRVPFYQKPVADHSSSVINGDLIVPPVVEGGFYGEILGAGQRQDTVEEMYESLKRQGCDPSPYEWYIDLRRDPRYKTTSGFGLGLERFIAWALGKSDIKDVAIYPRLKNVKMHP